MKKTVWMTIVKVKCFNCGHQIRFRLEGSAGDTMERICHICSEHTIVEMRGNGKVVAVGLSKTAIPIDDNPKAGNYDYDLIEDTGKRE